MISREQFDAYNRAVANLSDGAQREIEPRIMSWLQTDEGRSASVAECREYAKSVMSGVVQVYDSAAASLAAEWYDKRAADSGARLPAAVTATTYNPESVDETARYRPRSSRRAILAGSRSTAASSAATTSCAASTRRSCATPPETGRRGCASRASQLVRRRARTA